MRARLTVTLLGMFLVGATPSSALGAEQRWLPFGYAAPADCPGADDFAALVAGHTGGAWILRQRRDQRGLSVEIATTAQGKIGRLRRDAPPAAAPREVIAADCTDVVRALALTVALSLGEEPPVSRDVALGVTLPPPPAPPAVVGVGLGLSVGALVPPFPMVGAALFIERGRRSWPRGRFLHPADLRFTVAHVRDDLLGQTGKARFDLTTGAALACPLGFSALRLCAGIEAGWLNGRGREIATPRADRSLWVATGGLAQGRLALGQVVFLEVSAGVWVPWRRASFVFDSPPQPVAKVPAVVATGGAALGFSIP